MMRLSRSRDKKSSVFFIYFKDFSSIQAHTVWSADWMPVCPFSAHSQAGSKEMTSLTHLGSPNQTSRLEGKGGYARPLRRRAQRPRPRPIKAREDGSGTMALLI